MTSRSKFTGSAVAGLALLGVTVWLLFAGGAFEADAVTDDHHYEGTVMQAGDSTLVLQMMPDNDAVSFRVNADTRILKDGQPVKLEAVHLADQATVDATLAENVRVATAIAVRSPY